jgi:hypothetical protein
MTSIIAARSRELGLLLWAGVIGLTALAGGTGANAAGNGTILFNPSAQTVNHSFAVTIQTNVNVAISGAQTDFTFDQTKLQIVGLTRGSDWNGASFPIGVAPQTQQQAIAESNSTGRLKNIGAYFDPPGTITTGTHTFATITMAATQCGNMSLGTSLGEINDANGAPATVTHNSGSANVQNADLDGDGVTCTDNCPTWANPAQGLPPWPVPANDPDCDGFGTVVENSAGTAALVHCGANAWSADINNDTFVDVIGDIAAVAAQFGQSVPPGLARYDIAPDPPDHVIDVIGDIARLAGLFSKTCS